MEITLDGDDVLHYDCDCPYEDLCKHVVAALYAIRQATTIEIPAKGGRKKALPKTPKMSFEAILPKIDRKALEDFLLDYAAKQPELRTHFLFAFADRFDDAEGKAKYLRHLDLALSFGEGKRGFFHYRAGREAMHKISEMLDNAENLLTDRPQEAFFAASATLEKMAHVIKYLDDSHGEGSGVIYRALELLSEVWRSDPPQSVETEMFDFAWKAVSGGIYTGWSDFEDELINMILNASNMPERGEKALHLLDSKMKDALQKKEEWSRDYSVENILRQKIAFLKQLRRETEARELMLQP